MERILKTGSVKCCNSHYWSRNVNLNFFMQIKIKTQQLIHKFWTQKWYSPNNGQVSYFIAWFGHVAFYCEKTYIDVGATAGSVIPHIVNITLYIISTYFHTATYSILLKISNRRAVRNFHPSSHPSTAYHLCSYYQQMHFFITHIKC